MAAPQDENLQSSTSNLQVEAAMARDTPATANELPTEKADAPPVTCASCCGQCPAGLCASVVELAKEWMLDFMFICLCQHFKQRRMSDFERSRNALDAILQGIPKLEPTQMKTVYMCQFLSRIAEGQNLDVQFEKDAELTPLEAALLIWESIKREPGKCGTLHEEIELLVKIQAVTVCMEKGNYKQATEVLERLFREEDANKPIRMKLAMIITKKDPYHQFLQGLSYNRMLRKINEFVDIVLSERPANFLFKAATKVVEAEREAKATTSQFDENRNDFEKDSDNNCEKKKRLSRKLFSTLNRNKDADLNENKVTNFDENKESKYFKEKKTTHTDHNLVEESSIERNVSKKEDALRAHKRLFTIETHKLWSPGQHNSDKKLTAKRKKSDLRSTKSLPVTKRASSPSASNESTIMKKKKPWVPAEDDQLLKGVKEFGAGNWRQILNHYKFNNRTGVMLKDRWRTMQKLNIVGSKSDMY